MYEETVNVYMKMQKWQKIQPYIRANEICLYTRARTHALQPKDIYRRSRKLVTFIFALYVASSMTV